MVKFKFFVLWGLLTLLGQTSKAQTYCLNYALVKNTHTVDIAVSLISSSPFKLGAGNLQFKYNPASLSHPTLVSDVLTPTSYYNGVSVTSPTPPSFAKTNDALVSFNFNFTGNTNKGLLISTEGTDIAIIRFQIEDPNSSPNLRPYDNGSVGTVVYNDDTNNPTLLATTGHCAVYDNPIVPELLNPNVYLTANASPKTVTIDWATTLEKNSSCFIVERSKNNKTFELIGKLKAANKASNYTFLDTHPFSLNYYRVRQIDMDGTETISSVHSIWLDDNIKLKVFPTLLTTADKVLNIDVLANKDAKPMDYQIVNVSGQQVLNGKTAEHVEVNIAHLATGTYIVKIGEDQVKFVIQ